VVTIDRRRLLGTMACLAAVPARAEFLPSYPAPTREAMVPVEGGRIYVRVNGDLTAARPPVVFIHGGPGGTHGSLLEMLPLAADRAVILYDQLDSGRSDQPNDPKNWRVARFVDELDAIRRSLGVARWHVVGHSWGGTVALEYGARRPRALAGLGLASPLVATRSWLADANALIGQLPAETAGEIRRCIPLRTPQPPACDAATKAFYASFNRRVPGGAAMAAYSSTQSGRGFNPRLYQAMWGNSEFVSTGSLQRYDGEPLLAKLDGKRTLFICGQYDEARPATLEAYARRVPGAEFAVVPGGSHGFPVERPEETRTLLARWLARQDQLL
jgi:proline iminopeptidase/L-proline amide hydrolase